MLGIEGDKVSKCKHPGCTNSVGSSPKTEGRPKKYCEEHRNIKSYRERKLENLRQKVGMSDEEFQEFRVLYYSITRERWYYDREKYLSIIKDMYEEDVETFILLYEANAITEKDYKEIISGHSVRDESADNLDGDIGEVVGRHLKNSTYGKHAGRV